MQVYQIQLDVLRATQEARRQRTANAFQFLKKKISFTGII